MTILSMDHVMLKEKRVMIREDFNVPFDQNGEIANDKRIRAALPTIKRALEHNARIIILSHCGRPTEGEYDEKLSLVKVAKRLSELLNYPVDFKTDWLDGVDVEPGQIVLCENVRFNRGEKANDEELSEKMAKLCDVFVMDAFATAHRGQASTEGIARCAKVAVAGPLLLAELASLAQGLRKPQSPIVAIVGGAKVSSKLTVLEKLVEKVDSLIVGGGIANTFLAARGVNVGNSLVEKELLGSAKQLLEKAKTLKVDIPLPVDVIVAKEFSIHATAEEKLIDDVQADEMILDIGAQTRQQYCELLHGAKTIVWNGPVGVFEFPAFADGTEAIVNAVAESNAFSIAGGGDTMAAIDQYNAADNISYISTGGGAFLKYMEGATLPVLATLQAKAQAYQGDRC